ncbi:hypothetical protein EYF80_041736 [Liparis tanakae]|uniref:Uncharacterized protein n=1 Tax=Liparis tanakae TaxID=230148 RepID=A0A4Z2G3G7_9TELE|nr:hypothetical protein EYF80_041736 [Liparis tanakae]
MSTSMMEETGRKSCGMPMRMCGRLRRTGNLDTAKPDVKGSEGSPGGTISSCPSMATAYTVEGEITEYGVSEQRQLASRPFGLRGVRTSMLQRSGLLVGA